MTASFVTEFYHHINVAMDAEAVLFIHDLITSYVKEKDKGKFWLGMAYRPLQVHRRSYSHFLHMEVHVAASNCRLSVLLLPTGFRVACSFK